MIHYINCAFTEILKHNNNTIEKSYKVPKKFSLVSLFMLIQTVTFSSNIFRDKKKLRKKFYLTKTIITNQKCLLKWLSILMLDIYIAQKAIKMVFGRLFLCFTYASWQYILYQTCDWQHLEVPEVKKKIKLK